MQDERDAQMKNDLRVEIQEIEESYLILRNYLLGAEYDALEMVGRLKIFKDSLDRISTRIMTLYTLRGQRTKITWNPLLNNISNALATLNNQQDLNPRAAIQAALTMSQPNATAVMSYLDTLKKSLQ